MEHTYDCPGMIFDIWSTSMCALYVFMHLGAPPSAYMAYFTMPLDDSTFGAPQCVLWMYFYSLGALKCAYGAPQCVLWAIFMPLDDSSFGGTS
jgi:hypothetical protein